MTYDYYEMCQNDDNGIAEKMYSAQAAIECLLKLERRLPSDMLNSIIENAPEDYDEREFKSLFNSDNIVRWCNGMPVSRDKAFELSIYFGLDYFQAEIFVRKYCFHEWLYYGNYKDLIYYFFLQKSKILAMNGKDRLLRCRNLIASVKKCADNDNSKVCRYDNASKLKMSVDELCTADELEKFIRNANYRFDKFNMIAYSCFMNEIDKNIEAYRRKYGIEKTLSRISGQMSIDFTLDGKIYAIKLANFGKYRKLLKELIYGNVYRVGLEATVCGKKQVTRKQLIMIVLLNECENDAHTNFKCAEETEIRNRRVRLNKMLYECGFPVLDASAPYDWLILNALAGIVYNREELQNEKSEAKIANVKRFLSDSFFNELVRAIENDISQ